MTWFITTKPKAILDVDESLRYSFRRLLGQIYEHPEHYFLRFLADINTFKWVSRNLQRDEIEFIQLVSAVSFKEAVSSLETGDFELAKVE